MIKNSKWYTPIALAIVAAGALTSSAIAGDAKKPVVPVEEEEESWWSASLSAGYDSKYMFRGVYLLNEDGENIDNLLYTDLSFSAFGATLGAWYASSWDDDYNELDLYASYTYSIGETGIDLTGGGIYYAFPDFEDTWELFAGITYTGFAWVTPSLYYYYDFEVYDGSYIEFKLASTIPLRKSGEDTVLSLDPYALIAVGDYNTYGEEFDANHIQGGLALVWAMSENITLSAYAAVSEPLDAIDDSQDTEVWGGGKITFAF